MATSRLDLHAGGREVTREELMTIEAPPPTETWFPVSHGKCITTVEETLTASGFHVTSTRFGLARNDARLFATMDLASTLATGVTLAVCIRNSFDKTFPLGFIAGERVFVCSNLAFNAMLNVARKHTKNGHARFSDAINETVGNLDQFKEHAAARIRRLKGHDLSEQEAESLMLRSFEQRIISHRILAKVIGEWRHPTFDDFEQRDAWSLLNAFTTALGGGAKCSPQEHAQITMQLYGPIDGFVGIAPFALPAPASPTMSDAPADGEEANDHA
jgi:hypothetical protein